MEFAAQLIGFVVASALGLWVLFNVVMGVWLCAAFSGRVNVGEKFLFVVIAAIGGVLLWAAYTMAPFSISVT